jgi:hypothetical protein
MFQHILNNAQQVIIPSKCAPDSAHFIYTHATASLFVQELSFVIWEKG